MTIRIELDFRQGLADPSITRGPGGPILSLDHGQTSVMVALSDPLCLAVLVAVKGDEEC
jgi:hypothetical protein